MDAFDLHLSNEYFVKLTQLETEDGFSVIFPGNILSSPKIPSVEFIYSIVEEGISIDCPILGQEEVLVCDNYAKRICIMVDIFVKCFALDISQTLIKGYTKDGEPYTDGGWLKMLKELEDPEDKEKELTLLGVFYNILNRKEIDIEKCVDVLEGKDLIYHLYEREGFKL